MSWGTTKLKKPNMTHNSVIKGILARLSGLMEEWFISLGDYRQRQWTSAQSLDAFFDDLHWKFAKSKHPKEKVRGEFFKLKCCSYEPKDLESDFKEIMKRYYVLDEMDDDNLISSTIFWSGNPHDDGLKSSINVLDIYRRNSYLGIENSDEAQ